MSEVGNLGLYLRLHPTYNFYYYARPAGALAGRPRGQLFGSIGFHRHTFAGITPSSSPYITAYNRRTPVPISGDISIPTSATDRATQSKGSGRNTPGRQPVIHPMYLPLTQMQTTLGLRASLLAITTLTSSRRPARYCCAAPLPSQPAGQPCPPPAHLMIPSLPYR